MQYVDPEYTFTNPGYATASAQDIQTLPPHLWARPETAVVEFTTSVQGCYNHGIKA